MDEWKAEQDAERNNIRGEESIVLTKAKYAAMVAELEARKAIADIQRMGFQECEADVTSLRAQLAELESELERWKRGIHFEGEKRED